MQFDVTMAGDKIEIDYDGGSKEALIKAGFYSLLRIAIDQERIAELEDIVKKQTKEILELKELYSNLINKV